MSEIVTSLNRFGGNVDFIREVAERENGVEMVMCAIEDPECGNETRMFLLMQMANTMVGRFIDSQRGDVVCRWCWRMMEQEKPEAIVRGIALVFAKAVFVGWENDEVMRCLREVMEMCTTLESDYLAAVAFMYVEKTVEAFRGTRNEFANRVVPECKDVAMKYISKQRGRSAGTMSAALGVVKECVSGMNCDDNGFIVQATSLKIGEWGSDEVDAIFEVYRKEVLGVALDCIYCYAATAKQSFLGDRPETLVLQSVQRVLRTTVENKIGLDRPHNMFMVSRILEKWVRKTNAVVLMNVPESLEFFGVVRDMSCRLFQNVDCFQMNPEICYNVIAFWSSLARIMGNGGAEAYRDHVYDVIEAVAKAYTTFLYVLVSRQTVEEECLFQVLDYERWTRPLHILFSRRKMELCDFISTFIERKGPLELSLTVKILGSLLVDSTPFHDAAYIERITTYFMRIVEMESMHPFLDKCIVDVIRSYKKSKALEPFSNRLTMRILQSLAFMPTDHCIIRTSIDAIDELYVSEMMVKQLVNEYQRYSFLNMSENLHVRGSFLGLLLKLSCRCHVLPLYLQTLEARFAESSLTDMATDLVGIFRKGKPRIDLISWFVERYGKVLECEMPVALMNEVLKLWHFVTNPTLVFPEFSPLGHVLFHASTSIVRRAFVIVKQLESDEKMKIVKRISRLMTNILDNKYVCFEVFRLYGDTTLDELVRDYAGFVTWLSPSEVLQYQKSCSAVWDSVTALAKRHLRWCDIHTFDAIVCVVDFGISCSVSSVTDSSFNIIGLVCKCDRIDRAHVLSRYADNFRRYALSLWNRIMSRSLVNITQYGPILRRLILTDISIMDDLKASLVDRCHGEHLTVIRDAFLDIDGQSTTDLDFNECVERICNLIRRLNL